MRQRDGIILSESMTSPDPPRELRSLLSSAAKHFTCQNRATRDGSVTFRFSFIVFLEMIFIHCKL